MNISLCLIVRNEEEKITKCLESFRSLCDEIVVVDTGSTDDTIDLAEKFGAKIFLFSWIDNFSAARNFAIEKATGDWIMMIDADYLIDEDTAEKLKKDLEHLPENIEGVMLPCLLQPYGTHAIYKPAIWKKSLDAKYKLAVHEYLDLSKEQLSRFIRLECPVRHTQPLKNFQRNIDILTKEIEKDPENPRYIYYLGQDNQHNGNYAEAKKWYGKFTELTGTSRDERHRAWVNIGVCCEQLGDENSAIAAYEKGIEINPAFIDPYLLLGKIMEKRNAIEDAVGYYVIASKCQKPVTHISVNESFYKGYAERQLTELLKKIAPPS